MRICVLLLAFMLATQALEVALLDGATLTVPSHGLTDHGITVGDQRYPLSRCDWLAEESGAPGQQAGLGIAPLGVILRDGGYLPALDVTLGTKPDRLLVTSPLGSFDLALGQILAWGQRPTVLDRPQNLTQDRLLLLNGQELSGEVQGLTAAGITVATDLADEPLVIPMAQLRSVYLAIPATELVGLHLRLVHDPSLPPLFLAAEYPWRLLGVEGAVLQPSLPLPRLNVMGGDKQALSALQPSAVAEKGAFDVVWPWTRNKQIDGDPIQLRGRLYDSGIVLHSYAKLTYDLNQGYDHFRAQAGIVDAMGHEGDCLLRIVCDGKEMFAKRVRGQEPIDQVDIDLRGVQRMDIVVEVGERYDIGDHVALGDAYLIRKATSSGSSD